MLEAFASRIRAVPLLEDPHELRRALVRLLDKFGFPEQIARPTRGHVADQELPQVMLNFNSLESLRRAFVAAIKAIEIAGTLGSLSQTKLALLIEEVRRALDSPSRLPVPQIRAACEFWKRQMCAACVFARSSLPA